LRERERINFVRWVLMCVGPSESGPKTARENYYLRLSLKSQIWVTLYSVA